MAPRPILLAAGDDGPRQTLEPLIRSFGTIVNEGTDAVWASDQKWLELIHACKPRGLVCGTSDSPEGRAVEVAARRAAAQADIPVALVEDFPGNYRAASGCDTGLLLVESQAVAALTRARLGSACPPLHVLSPARYDPHRLQAAARRAAIGQSWADNNKLSVLWAGQPETADCQVTLLSLQPLLAGLQLLFKAHPRDAGYAAGAYRDLLNDSALSPIDITALPVEDALSLAPRLVITQFSSVAVEAGFYGIPSLNVLLPGAGADRLLEKKSLAVPPHCLEGAALHTHDSRALGGMIRGSITDESLRAGIIRCFDSYFSIAVPTLPEFVETLENLFTNRGISP